MSIHHAGCIGSESITLCRIVHDAPDASIINGNDVKLVKRIRHWPCVTSRGCVPFINDNEGRNPMELDDDGAGIACYYCLHLLDWDAAHEVLWCPACQYVPQALNDLPPRGGGRASLPVILTWDPARPDGDETVEVEVDLQDKTVHVTRRTRRSPRAERRGCHA